MHEARPKGTAQGAPELGTGGQRVVHGTLQTSCKWGTHSLQMKLESSRVELQGKEGKIVERMKRVEEEREKRI